MSFLGACAYVCACVCIISCCFVWFVVLEFCKFTSVSTELRSYMYSLFSLIQSVSD